MSAEKKPIPPSDLAELDLGDLLLPPGERAPIKSGVVARAESASPQPSIPRASGLPIIVATGGRPPAARRISVPPAPRKPERSAAAQLVNLVISSAAFILAAMVVTWLIYR